MSWVILLIALIPASCLAIPADTGESRGKRDLPAIGQTDMRHSISELPPIARIHLGKTADWVAVTPEAIWVGTTGPFGVSQIDQRTNRLLATVALPGNPCAGLAVGFGGLWVPLCANPNTLARVDLHTRSVTLVQGVGPADREGGIATSADGVWLVADAEATLARIDPRTLTVSQRITLPTGSLNPLFSAGSIWVTRSTGAEVSVINAQSGELVATVPTGPKPRFLTAGGGAIWTLNQGDGTLTRIDARSRQTIGTTALQTPGHGGDVAFGHDIVWSTMAKVPLSATDGRTGKVLCQWTGPGGDSLGVSHDAIWLTDYEAGDIYRFDMEDTLRHCMGHADDSKRQGSKAH